MMPKFEFLTPQVMPEFSIFLKCDMLQGRIQRPKKGGGEIEKLGNHFATLQNQLMCMFAQRDFFGKMAVKSTFFELQHSFLHIF